MKKICIFLNITLILFFVFACTIPSEVEITGSPSIKFAANIDFSDFYEDMFNNVLGTGDNDIKMLPCTNPSLKYKTFLAYMKVFDDDYDVDLGFDDDVFNEDEKGTINFGDAEIPVTVTDASSDKIIFTIGDEDEDEEKFYISTSDPEKPITASFTGLNDYLSDFGFSTVLLKINIYMDDSPLLNCFKIDIYDESDDQPIEPTTIIGKTSELAGKDVYDGDKIPGGDSNVKEIKNTVNSNGELSFKYEIYLSAGDKIEKDWLDGTHRISAEIVIWFPLELESLVDNAKFIFPDFFNGISDVFKSVAETGAVKNMSIKIGIHPSNPFGEGLFVINDDNYKPIESPLEEDSFSFVLSEEDLEFINNNPFEPSYYILYPKPTKIGIPNGDIMVTTVSLNASIKYTVELKK